MEIFDRAHFDAMTGADGALQLEVIALFRGQAASWAGACARDESWRDAVHMIKGSARGIGLQALASACEAAENAADETLARTLVQRALTEALAALDQFVAHAGRGVSR